MIEDSQTEFGEPEEFENRWKRVVDLLDRRVPGWRYNSVFMGDAAMRAINALLCEVKVSPAAPRKSSFYVVRPTEYSHPSRPAYPRPTPMFDPALRYDLEGAKAKALELAQKNKKKFVVFGVDEIGTAGTTEPLAVWTEKRHTDG